MSRVKAPRRNFNQIRSHSAPAAHPHLAEGRVVHEQVSNPFRVVLYVAPSFNRLVRSPNPAPRARSPPQQPISKFAQHIYYATTRPTLKRHWWRPRGEQYSLWIPPAASDYIDPDYAPDECYWVAIGHANHIAPTYFRNYDLLSRHISSPVSARPARSSV